VAEVEEVLGALRQTLPPLAWELNLQKTTVWGPVLVSASPAPLHSRDTPGEGHGGAGGTDLLPPFYHAPVGTKLGTLKGKFARTCAAVAGLADT